MAEKKAKEEEDLVEVTDEVNCDPAKLTLQERIVIAMNNIRIKKDGKNKFANYNYFKPDTINSKVNPLFLQLKIFPRFYTDYIKFGDETTQVTNMEQVKTSTLVTKYSYKEMAYLELIDILNPQVKEVYQMPIEHPDIKGANKMQNIGGARTYAKRYLYMEALNIADDEIDLDATKDSAKSKKPASQDEELAAKINEIKVLVNSLRDQKAKDIDIAAAIKEVFIDNGKPSAKYDECKSSEEAQAIINHLKEKFFN
mgnify:CR=1 FL=1